MNNKNNYVLYFLGVIIGGGLAGCSSGAQSPDFLFLNSYFPSWLVGSMAALVITVVLRVVLIRSGVDDFLPFRFFVYVGIWLILTMLFAYFYSPR